MMGVQGDQQLVNRLHAVQLQTTRQRNLQLGPSRAMLARRDVAHSPWRRGGTASA
jgi:hypothetical protein